MNSTVDKDTQNLQEVSSYSPKESLGTSSDEYPTYSKRGFFTTNKFYILALFLFALGIVWFFRRGVEHFKRDYYIIPDGTPDEVRYFLESRPSLARYIWGPSPYLKESREVRNKFEKEIMQTSTEINDNSRTLLIAIISEASELQLRHLVRTHQVHPYKHLNVTFKFVLPRISFAYQEAVQFENQTYGDIIVAEGNFIKMETYKYVEQNLGVYKYVAVLNITSFLNVPGFLEKYFTKDVQNLDLAMIALYVGDFARFDWSKGGFEAISWKLLKFIVKFYEHVPLTFNEEDLQIGLYLSDSGLEYNKIEFDQKRAYSFRKDSYSTHLTDVTADSIRLNELKSETDYMAVVSCFTPEGINLTQVEHLRSIDWNI